MIDFNSWTKATGDLKPGQQAVFFDFLTLVAEGQATLVHGADYSDNSPCLVNGTAQMLSHGEVSPMAMFPAVVSAFDSVCRQMQAAGAGTTYGRVSETMAEALLRNFGERKPMELTTAMGAGVEVETVYIEPSDEEMLKMIEALQDCGAPVEHKQQMLEFHDLYKYSD